MSKHHQKNPSDGGLYQAIKDTLEGLTISKKDRKGGRAMLEDDEVTYTTDEGVIQEAQKEAVDDE
jgi:hypothetical protein